MSTMVLTLTYEVESGDMMLFRGAVIRYAEATRHRETACLRFDVSFGAERSTVCFVYVVFDTNDALDSHLDSDHFHLFEELTKQWVISKEEHIWELAASPRRGGVQAPST